MRRLLNTLFVLSENGYLTVDGENVVVSRGKQEIGRIPMHTIESIRSFSYAGASPALMGACATRGIDVCFFSPRGRFLARVVGEERGNVLLRQQQYRIADDQNVSCCYARNFILGKVYNARWVLERATRDHPQRIPVEKVKLCSGQMASQLPYIRNCDNLERLRGLEGEAAQQYFSVWNHMILRQKEDFIFYGRNRRPPRDPVNALLSFAYVLLSLDCAAALQSVGLDPYVGFLHRPRPGRRGLALDLMEELRAVYADRFVLTLVNNRIIGAKNFQIMENGAVWLNKDGRKLLLNKWQERKRETVTHPFLGEKILWGLIPYVQALLLAKFIRKDLDGYPAFLGK